MTGLVRDPATRVVVSADGSDCGPAERVQHGVVITKRGVAIAGGGIVREGSGAQALHTDLFDRLDAAGWLSEPLPKGVLDEDQIEAVEDAIARRRAAYKRSIALNQAEDIQDSRRQAAMWLRQLFGKTGIQPRVTGNYGVSASGHDEMSDAEAWNRRCFTDMWRELGKLHADILEAVVCYETIPTGMKVVDLRNALDALARWRGF